MFKKLLTVIFYFLTFGFLLSTQAMAEEYIISGNGSGSDNSIQVTSSSTTTVNQTNSADINNNVAANANTGDNTASTNTGDATIATGNATSTSAVVNQGINSNSADNSCDCSQNPINVKISGNGSNSFNTVDLGVGGSSNAYQSNSAQITNNILNNANTGYNTASYNNGDVKITTGNALVLSGIKNKNINFNDSSLGSVMEMIKVSVSGNGDGSINLVKLLFDNSINYESNNLTILFNSVVNTANTGGNTANGNNGSVVIATGDAVSVVNIANENINGSRADLCDCKITPPPVIPPPGGGDPIIPPTGSSPSHGGGSSSITQNAGSVLGAAIGSILPATGGYWMLLMTILCLTLFLLGGYLRFGSGISPPFSYAV